MDPKWPLLIVTGLLLVPPIRTGVVTGWTNVGELLQSAWTSVLSLTGESAFALNVVVMSLLASSIFFVVGGVFLVMDLTGRPTFLRKYKTQEGANEPLEPAKLWGLMKQVLVNQLLVGPAFIYATYLVHQSLHGTDTSGNAVRTLPTFVTALAHLAAFVAVEEVMFFYSHWLLHHRAVYKFVHKRHHEWTAPVAYAAVYAHPLEHVVSNLLPPAVGPLLLNSHPLVTWTWYSVILVVTLVHHSGYHLPLLPSPEAHDFHHLKFTQNYGTIGVLDYLHGTDLLFRSNMAYKRHQTLYTTKSARELYPDAAKDE